MANRCDEGSSPTTYTFVIVRHGESVYNSTHRVTGWADSDLTDKGVEQARCVGQILKNHGYTFDVAFTSLLKRSIKTLYWIQDTMDLHWIPVHKHWRLNERHQGAFEGNRMDSANRLLKEAKAFDFCPPDLEESDERWQRLVNDPKYKMYDPSLFPKAESSKMAIERFLHYWHDTIVPEVKAGKKVLIVGHSNTIKSLHRVLHKSTDDEQTTKHLKSIEQGKPLVYEVDEGFFPLRSYYLH